MSSATGFRVAPARLDEAARELGDRAAALSEVQAALPANTLPAQAFGNVSRSAQAANSVRKSTSDIVGSLGTRVNRAHTIQTGLTACASGYRRTDTQVAAMYRALLRETPVPTVGKGAVR